MWEGLETVQTSTLEPITMCPDILEQIGVILTSASPTGHGGATGRGTTQRDRGGRGNCCGGPNQDPIYGATTRYFPIRRASVAYLVVCYNPFIGRGRDFRGHSLANRPDGITQLHF